MERAETALRIGFLGRIPPPLGGAGLEVQMERTAAALRELGHEVLAVEAADPTASFDLLHAFGSEPTVWHSLRHWTRNRRPLVVTSVVVVSPGREERILRLTARLPILTSGRMKAEVARQADVLVAGSEYERRLLTSALGAPASRVAVVGNGADPVEPGSLPDGVPGGGYILMVGAVDARKRQREVLRALAGRLPIVVAGPYAGPPAEREQWERAVRETGAAWLGPVGEQRTLAALRASAIALVHLSTAEVQSLAVLEALAAGLPAVASDIPSHRELAARYPGRLRLVKAPAEVQRAVRKLRTADREPAPVPTWRAVAELLVEVYGRALASSR